MKIIEEYRQNLVEQFIERSARIDVLVATSPYASIEVKMNYHQELEELRTKQWETTKKLHTLEDPNSNAWENIGNGG